MHFVHKRNPENDPAYELNEGKSTPLFPFHENREKNARFDLWEMAESESALAPDEDAFPVLMKILEDGHIRAGWSFRNGKPTIYGPRAACCFTEMPLYALVDYAKRRSSDAVGTYAIGLLRSELFAAGGRPALYGLSTPHREQAMASRGPAIMQRWPRKLHEDCGIPEHEQYRYVAMNLTGPHRIDWGHEREWRWVDGADTCSCPGLPVWLSEETQCFSEAILVVTSKREAERVLDKLKELFDAGEHDYGYSYDKSLLERTKVVSLEEISAISPDRLLTVRLDDLPASTIQTFKRPEVDAAFVEHVKYVLKEAHNFSEAAVKRFISKSAKDSRGLISDVCGFAHLMLASPQSSLATALIQLDEATVIGGVGYWVSDFGSNCQGQQALIVAETEVNSAIGIMMEYFPELSFYCQTRWD